MNKVKSDPKSLKLSGARLFLVHNVNSIIQKANWITVRISYKYIHLKKINNVEHSLRSSSFFFSFPPKTRVTLLAHFESVVSVFALISVYHFQLLTLFNFGSLHWRTRTHHSVALQGHQIRGDSGVTWERTWWSCKTEDTATCENFVDLESHG